MGSKFVEKHKRKSVLAALLFIFRGRAKYVSILLVVVLLSMPFVISGEMLASMIELPGVSAFLRGIGMGDMVASLSLKYSNNDALKAAMDRAAAESEQNSVWAKFLNTINATAKPSNGASGLAMLRGGNADLFGPPQVKDGANMHRRPDQVAGAVNDEEKRRGDDGADVDISGALARADGSGLYGDLMGTNLAGNFSGGSASGSAPYLNRTMMTGGGSVAGRGSGMYSKAMSDASGRVPVPSGPSRVKTKKMGKVSGFSWKNVGYRTSTNKMDLKLNSKKPMFQLAETFTMTGAAYKSKDSALEYQAAYTGSTYDGNDVDLPVIQTDETAPAVPDTAFAGDLMNGVTKIQEEAEACQQADGIYSPRISEDARQLDTIGNSLGKPPKCCSGGVGAWNSKISRMVYYCQDYNANSAALAAACQSSGEKMDCGRISSMRIKPCSKWKCFLALVLIILLVGLLFGGIGLALLGMSFLLGNVSLFGKINDMVSSFMSMLAGGK